MHDHGLLIGILACDGGGYESLDVALYSCKFCGRDFCVGTVSLGDRGYFDSRIVRASQKTSNSPATGKQKYFSG